MVDITFMRLFYGTDILIIVHVGIYVIYIIFIPKNNIFFLPKYVIVFFSEL